MTSHSITLSRRIPASPERVWRVLSNIENAGQTLSGVTRVEVLSDPPYAVGTRWRETRKMFGKEATEEMWVTAVEPQRKTVIEAESSGTHYTTTFTLAPDGEGTMLSMEFAGLSVSTSHFQTLLWRLFGKAGMRATQKVMQTDLDDIAAAATALS